MRERAQGPKTQGGPRPETRPGRGPTSEGVRATPPGGFQVRAALYARVSTEEQAERYGLTSQMTELRELAGRKGYEIVAELSDDGVSGATLDRPALTRLRDQARAGPTRLSSPTHPTGSRGTWPTSFFSLKNSRRSTASWCSSPPRRKTQPRVASC
jgi:Resolvase, N terminal domain